MISVAEADRLLGGILPTPQTELVSLTQAVGRRLAVPVQADRDGPPFDRVAMDGYAVSTGFEGRSWTVQGIQMAGTPPVILGEPTRAIEVATGAVLPQGCDAVVPYERTERIGDQVSLLGSGGSVEPGNHVHRQGIDYRAGATLLPAGTRLRSTHLHTLASVGMDPVPVVRRLVWALAVTGDELAEIRDLPQPWQIRRSNAAAIVGEARCWGLTPRGERVLPDQKPGLRAIVEQMLPGLDALILTGGVSAGLLDLVPGVMADLGAQTLFHKIAQRPGKPLWCGFLPPASDRPRTMIFGLPGNPVSSLFTFRRYVLPWLLAAEGRPLADARIAVAGLKPPPQGQTVFLPWSQSQGVLDWHGSGDYLALAESDGFLEINDDPKSLVEPRVHRWGGGF